MWQLNENHVIFNLEWKIPAYSFLYKCGTRRCNLFLTEKYLIIKEDPLILLNKHNETNIKILPNKQVHTSYSQ